MVTDLISLDLIGELARVDLISQVDLIGELAKVDLISKVVSIARPGVDLTARWI